MISGKPAPDSQNTARTLKSSLEFKMVYQAAEMCIASLQKDVEVEWVAELNVPTM